MRNQKYVDILKNGVDAWNAWRKANPDIVPDLSGKNFTGCNFRNANFSWTELSATTLAEANLHRADLRKAVLINAKMQKADLSYAQLTGADLRSAQLEEANLANARLIESRLQNAQLVGAYLMKANLARASLQGANLSRANLTGATLKNANLSETTLTKANFSDADLTESNLTGANLTKAILIDTTIERATLKDCYIYGISVWDLQGTPREQANLAVSDITEEQTIKVSKMEVAPFFYLLFNNENIGDMINETTEQMVLILGRFNSEQKQLLDVIWNELRTLNYLPMLFDFKRPNNIGWIDTVAVLAHLARFIIADFTDPKIMLQEVQFICSNAYRPLLPLLREGDLVPTTYIDHKAFNRNVLDIWRYKDEADLIANLRKNVNRAEERVEELTTYYTDLRNSFCFIKEETNTM